MVPKEIPWSKVKHHWEVYLFILPTLLLIGLFQYYPAASGIFHSFFRWNGADISEYVGLENYVDLVQSSEFWNSFRVAFFLGAWNIAKMIPALLVAVCIHRCASDRMRFFYRIMFVVPMVIPPLVVVLIWRSFFFEAVNGFLNKVLYATGLFSALSWLDQFLGWGGVFAPGQTPAWLGDPRLIITACIVWGFPWVGSFAVLTHLAKLGGIDRQIYEAAEIDGVNWWSKFLHVELPLITGSIYILLVFAIIGTIKDAGMILALAGMEGGPGGHATVPALFMIRKAFIDQRMGYACAVGIILTLVVMGLQKFTNMHMTYELLKRWQKVTYRAALIAVALALVAFNKFWPLAVVLFLLAYPHRATLIATAAISFWKFWDNALVDAVRQRVEQGSDAPSPWGRVIVLCAVAVWLLAVLPWRAILARLGPNVKPLEWMRDYIERRREARLARFGSRGEILVPTMLERLGQRNARLCKHLTIWAVLAVAFLPAYLMVIVSVKSNQQFYEAPGVVTEPYHWENWATAWEQVKPSIANSIFISTSATAVALCFALCGGYFFARVKMPFSAVFWNAILILMMMPTIANLIPLFRLLGTLNLLNTLTALILVGASAGQIMGIFVLRTFIGDIPQDLVEAAEIDGASHFQQMRTIVLPLSGPILGTIGVMHFITQWNDFVLPLIVMRDRARLPVMVQLLRMSGEYIKLWGPLMAGYAIASIPVIFLFVCTMKLFIRGMTEGAIKN